MEMMRQRHYVKVSEKWHDRDEEKPSHVQGSGTNGEIHNIYSNMHGRKHDRLRVIQTMRKQSRVDNAMSVHFVAVLRLEVEQDIF